MREPAVALWGHWPRKRLTAEILRAVADGEYQAVMKAETRVGVVSVLWSETCLEIAQLFIEPKHQRRGVGRSTVSHIVRQALRTRKPVIARVLVTNPARAFWERVGFTVVDSTDEDHLLEHRA